MKLSYLLFLATANVVFLPPNDCRVEAREDVAGLGPTNDPILGGGGGGGEEVAVGGGGGNKLLRATTTSNSGHGGGFEKAAYDRPRPEVLAANTTTTTLQTTHAKPLILAEDIRGSLKDLSSMVESITKSIEVYDGAATSSQLDVEQIGDLVKGLNDFKTVLTRNRLAVIGAPMQDKRLVVEELAGSFGILVQLTSVLHAALGGLTPSAATSWLAPNVDQMKIILGAAEATTADLLEFMGSLSSTDAGAQRRLNEDELEEDVDLIVDQNASFSFYQEEEDQEQTDDFQDKKHWHGFRNGQEYRQWRQKFARVNPRLNHLFDITEHLSTGNYDAVHRKAFNMAESHHSKYFGNYDDRRRKLQSKASVLDQCKLLVKCAKGMSLYDLIFYQFSDYIDTKTGEFAQSFRLPPKYDDETIKKQMHTINNRASFADSELNEPNDTLYQKDKTLKACNRLLDSLHLETPTKDPEHWSWKGGVVSEVCYASGTVKKIDIWKIREQFGLKVAFGILKETIYAAKALHKKRDMSKFKDEPFIFLDKENKPRYPAEIKGFPTDAEDVPKIHPVSLEKFYDLKPVEDWESSTMVVTRYYSRLKDIKPQPETECPSYYKFEANDYEKSEIICKSTKEDMAVKQNFCSLNRGSFEDKDAQYVRCRVKQSQNPKQDNDLLKSIKRIYGDTSLGQIAALAEASDSYPGYCCLDFPSEPKSGTWGEPYLCKDQCQNYAPSFAGLSQSSCDIFGGQWCPYPTDCSELKSCIKEYLKSSSNAGTDANPTFHAYLSEAPKINKQTDAEQCGRAREYFGFDPTFPIDMKICNEIGEYKNAGDMKFLEDQVKKMPASGKKKEELPGGTETVGSGGTPYTIKLDGSIKLVDAAEPKSGCNEKIQTAWKALHFTMSRIVEVSQELRDSSSNFECPEDMTGVVKSLCAVAKNIIDRVMAVGINIVVTVLGVAEVAHDEICSYMDPQSEGDTFEQVKAVYKNTNTIFNALSLRHEASHKSLDELHAKLYAMEKDVKKCTATSTRKLAEVEKSEDASGQLISRDDIEDIVKEEMKMMKEEMAKMMEMLQVLLGSNKKEE